MVNGPKRELERIKVYKYGRMAVNMKDTG